MEPVTLTTERLVLRPFGPADAKAVHTACQDPEIPRWTDVPSPYTQQHAAVFVTQTCPDGWRDETMFNFAVISRDDGRLVGAMGLVRLQLARATAELGYWTAKESRGRGRTAEAALAVARWAFGELGIERLEWFAEAGNSGSQAVALKTGFRMEGTLRAKLVRDGTRRDAWTGALLPSDLGLPSGMAYLPSPSG